MRLHIEHTTTSQYARPVSFGRHRLVIRPREGHDLRVERMELRLTPTHRLRWIRDVFGNSIAVAEGAIIEGEIPNENGAIRPGSFAEVIITVDPHATGIAIPREAILSFAGTDRVFIVNNGRLDDRVIKTGRSMGSDRIEIVSGLQPGLNVVLAPDGHMSKGQKVVTR